MASKDFLSSPGAVDPCPASMKGKAASIVTGPKTPPNKEPAQFVDSYVSLGNLRFGTACTVRVMVCRKWESTDLKGKPISTDYIISDEHVCSPLLVLHGAADKVTDPRVSKFLYEKASSKDKTLKLYDGGFHSILEGEPDDLIFEIFDDIVKWLDSRCTSTK